MRSMDLPLDISPRTMEKIHSLLNILSSLDSKASSINIILPQDLLITLACSQCIDLFSLLTLFTIIIRTRRHIISRKLLDRILT